MNRKLAALIVAACALLPQLALARETGWLSVTQVGGQSTNIFVELSEAVGDDLGCAGTRLLVPVGTLDADAQKRFYALMVLAMTTGAKLRLAVSGCQGAYPSMVSTDYWFVRSN